MAKKKVTAGKGKEGGRETSETSAIRVIPRRIPLQDLIVKHIGDEVFAEVELGERVVKNIGPGQDVVEDGGVITQVKRRYNLQLPPEKARPEKGRPRLIDAGKDSTVTGSK
ncbi:MAG: hypothetical protein WC686_04610 [Candidatus Shapirobacteria bacterium]|jgi:hypothetical protein